MTYSVLRNFLLAGSVLVPLSAGAGELDVSGYIGGEVTVFPREGLYADQLKHLQAGVTARPEISWSSEDRNTSATIIGFGRYDHADEKRNHVDLREAWLAHDFDGIEVLAGVNKLFWGVTESRHLVDIINQSDALEYNNRDAKLGQAMFSVTARQDWGDLALIAMTGFRELDFPGPDGRLRPGLTVDTDNAVFEHSAEHWAPDFAVRYSNTFGDVDLGLSAFHGTSREARFVLNTGNDTLVPYYDRISQLGLDVQYTADSLLLKFEGIIRKGHGDTFGAVVTGAEYTLYQLAGTGMDLGLIAEYLYDGRDDSAPITPYDNDVFVGLRLAMNDTQDTSALVGASIDLDDGAMGVRAEFERRIMDGLTFEADIQYFVNADKDSDSYGFRRDSYASITLKKHF
ncbi:MAG: hypothetical protein JKY49_02160 [Cohaesibacteraceae bacterium]|nr:hypothetical protein [Cohaesibacteraceae bacterium]